MPPLIVPCPHCTRPSRLDPERLPDQPAHYPCPHCKGKVVVDKRQLLNQQAAQAPAPTATVAPVAPAASAPSAAPATVGSTAPADRRFTSPPAHTKFPSGIVLGEDDDVIDQLREQLAALGSELDRVPSADAARQMIINEGPDLCIYVGGNVPAPPYVPMAPLTGLAPSLRRSLYLVLVADNLQTLDGTAAFMYQVNMILGKNDLSQFGAALYSGTDYHSRLYKPYFRASDLHSPT